MDNKKIALFALIALIFALLLFLWLRPDNTAVAPTEQDGTEQNQNNSQDPNENVETATNTLPPTKNSLLVSTQIAGEYVTIDNIYLEEPAFVVVHRANGNNPGEIIGNSGLIGVGSGQDIEISANIEAGKNYYAMLHKDNGDKKFNASTDEPLVGADGKPIMAMFQVSN